MATRTTSSASTARVASVRAVTPNAAITRLVPIGSRTGINLNGAVTRNRSGGSGVGAIRKGASRTTVNTGSGVTVLNPLPGLGVKPIKTPATGSGNTSTDPGGTVGGFSNALSGDLLGQFGLSVPKLLELVAIALAAWLGWQYLARKAKGKGR